MDTSTMTDELYRIELSLQLSIESLADMLICKSPYDDGIHAADYLRTLDCFNECVELKNDIIELKRRIE